MQRGAPGIAGLAVLVGMGAISAVGCKKDEATPAAATVASAAVPSPDAPGPTVVLSKTAKLAAIGMHTGVYAQPNQSKKIGYLRVGSVVQRSDTPFGTDGCPGGWYGVAPTGFVCVGKHATLDIEAPIVRAANVRPDLTKPLPYAYGFMRGVSPLYLRLPSRQEQERQEYKLENHFKWFEAHKAEEQKVALGANDLARELLPDAAVVPPSDTTPDGVLLGGKTNEDPPPFWVENGNRLIPNVTGFDVQPESFFANRIKRHTGVSFIGAFDAGPNLDHRRFAVTVDMRLLPIDKIKPEVGSAFHGFELTGDITLPVAFAKPCDPKVRGEALKPCRKVFREHDGRMSVAEGILPTRAFLQLTGTRKVFDGQPYLETKAGYWVKSKDVGVAITPHRWPGAADRGEKWIDVSIEDETLVLWEGKKPVFATLVSAGQDGMKDPKTTKSTIRGFFRLKSKHITATMDSSERSAQSGGAQPAPEAGESATADDAHDSAFELRDVPWVQYFHEGYALHAAYWHDRFGTPRSHGCINLAPIDALRVFRFTDPPVPEGWHGIQIDPNKGTVVIVHQ